MRGATPKKVVEEKVSGTAVHKAIARRHVDTATMRKKS